MAVWNSEEVLKFIDLYQNEPIVRNPKYEQHKNKNKINDSWNRIADHLNVPVNELKKKKESLIATFRLHHKKKTQMKHSGMGEDELYNPIWPFYEPLHNFLKDVYERRSVINTEDNSASTSTRPEKETITNMDPNSPVSGTSSNSETKYSKVPVVKRRSKDPPELAEASIEMSNAFTTLNRVLTKNTVTQEDDCDLYGRLLATKLRKFSEIEREDIMLEMDNILIKRRRDTENTHTNSYNYTNRPLSSYGSEWSCSSSLHNRPPSAESIQSTYEYINNQPRTQRVQILSKEIVPVQTIEVGAPPHIQPESHVHDTLSQNISTQSNLIYQTFKDAENNRPPSAESIQSTYEYINNQPRTQRVQILSQEIVPIQTIEVGAPTHIQPESHVHDTLSQNISTQSNLIYQTFKDAENNH